jgi:(1->4)-alpha-D-glucan 1-alpha-D-glucosylmutase
MLRLTTPGVPDLYQGSELWDFSLVDPDNRRPVDYMIRQEMLADEGFPQKLMQWKTGAIKQHVIQRILSLRQQYFELFNAGEYVPLEVSGPRAAHVLAFMRKDAQRSIIVIAPRLTHSFTEIQLFTECNLQLNYAEDCWKGTLVHLPDMMNSDLCDGISGQGCHMYSGKIELAKVFKSLPLALLLVGSNNQGDNRQ